MQHAAVYPHFVFACLPSIACVPVGHLRLEVCGRVEAQRCFVIVGSISISILRVMFVHWILGVGLYIQRKFYGVVLVVLVYIYKAYSYMVVVLKPGARGLIYTKPALYLLFIYRDRPQVFQHHHVETC